MLCGAVRLIIYLLSESPLYLLQAPTLLSHSFWPGYSNNSNILAPEGERKCKTRPAGLFLLCSYDYIEHLQNKYRSSGSRGGGGGGSEDNILHKNVYSITIVGGAQVSIVFTIIRTFIKILLSLIIPSRRGCWN